MSALHVVVRPRPERAPNAALAPLYGLFDVVVDGVNVTARIGEGEALALLGELGRAVGELCSGRRDRTSLRLYAGEEAWELGLEADGPSALITVFRTGPAPEVVVHERRVALEALREGVLAALRDIPLPGAGAPVRAALDASLAELEGAWPPVQRSARQRERRTLSVRAVRGFGLTARAELRVGARSGAGPVERSDLHGLLLRGSLELRVASRRVSLEPVQLFLVTERLLALADDVLEAWSSQRPLFRRIEVGSLRIGVRRGPGDVPLALTLGGPAVRGADARGLTFPELDAAAFVRVATELAGELVDAFCETDPAQGSNLRLLALAGSARSLAERLDDAVCDDSLTNPTPESYRSFGVRKPRAHGRGRWEHGGAMRFSPRWVATVPNIDLRSTFLCGEHLVVGSARETACLDRSTGGVCWRMPTERAAALSTPAGLMRVHPDGRISLHDLNTGESRFSVQVKPRVAGGASGAVVHTPGLPKLLVVAEADRQITAIDLVSGEIRWRHTARRPGAYRMRRAGKLLLVAGGDTAIFALDVVSGEVVWRVRDRLPFTGDVAVDHDSAFAISGVPRGPARLHHLDPWTGELRWQVDLDDHPTPGRAPLVCPETVVVTTRDRRGCGAHAYSRDGGADAWLHAPGLVGGATSWLVVDDHLIANSAAGVLVCLDSVSGNSRYSHVFARNVEADQPRRLEPVLRSGALFVPQHEVHVVRPRDGEVIGTVPTDLIPDLLRVDERCDVYVAEESGHVAAFGVAAKLTLVKA